MREIVFRFNTQVPLPMVIDSTEAPVIEEALQLIGGKPIINSINLEDGGERIQKVAPLCRKYGAAVIALTIDEEGMARTAERKVAVARRIHDLVVGGYGMRPHDVIFDALTFTLGSGDEEFRRAGIETLPEPLDHGRSGEEGTDRSAHRAETGIGRTRDHDERHI